MQPCRGQAPGQPVGQPDRQGHQRRGLVAGKAEGRHLVLDGNAVDLPVGECAFIKTAALLGRQFLEAGHDTAGLRIKSRLVIANVSNHLSGDVRDIHSGFRGEAGRNEDNARRDCAFGDERRVGVLLQKPVQDRIADLIAQFVWMPLGDRLGGEHEVFLHRVFLS